jgi:AcrR family transcriptional regulator
MADMKSTPAARAAVGRRRRLTRQDKRQANRARILRAARKVFGRRGYHGATIEEIADEAGLSNGAVYYNFENKEDLFLALLEDWRAELIGDVEHVFARAVGERRGSGEAQLKDELRQIVSTLRPSREWQLLLLEFATYAARNPGFRRRFVAGRRRFKTALADALESRLAALDLHPAVPPDQLTVLLTALVNGLAVDQLTEPGAVPDNLLGDAVVALLRPR